MFTTWVVFHVIVCIALILVVLMQSSKGEGLAGTAFSSGLSGAVFGGRGAATFLSKATSVLAIVFMLNCIVLAFMSARKGQVVEPGSETASESVVTREAQKEYEQEMQRQQQQMGADSTTPATSEPVDLEDLMNTPDTASGQ